MFDWDTEPSQKERTFSFFTNGLLNLWELLGVEKKRIGIAVGVLAFVTLLDLTVPLIIKVLFDEMPNIATREISFIFVGFLVAGMFVAKIASLWIRRFVAEPLFLKSLIKLENWWPVMAQQKLLDLSLGFHERENTGKKIAKINKGCDKLIDILGKLYWELVPSFLYLTLNVLFIMLIDWRLGLLFLLPLIPAVYINLRGYEHFIDVWKKWDERKETAIGFFCQSLINVQTVQSFVQEKHEREQLYTVRKEMEDMDIKASLGIQKYLFTMGAVLNLCFVFTIVMGLFFVYNGTGTVGTVVFVIATGNVTIQNIWGIVNTYTRMMRDIVSAQRMKDLIDEKPSVQNMGGELVSSDYIGTIAFNDVGFCYGGKDDAVLNHLELTLKPGEMSAFVGKSGEGKTTIIRLLARMYDVTSGFITLDGTDIRDIDRDCYRRLFAIVQQDVEIFDTTLRKNIVYSSAEATDEEVSEAVEASYLSDMISHSGRFPDGLNTQVGERGIRLSGGERQRVGIARAYLALLCGARVLILDEATSSLDSESESAIQNMIGTLREKLSISIVAIAHRLSTINQANNIYVIGEGRVIEQGDHERLMAQNGLYSKLTDLQSAGLLRD